MSIGRARRNLSTINAIHKALLELRQEKEQPNDLFHYTSVTVLDSVLEHAQLWASNIFYLNDAEEYYRGISFLLGKYDSAKYKNVKQIIEEIRNENGFSSEGVFSISFSRQPDNLHQWITYSKEAGVCLGFDNKLLQHYKIVYDAIARKQESKLIYGLSSEVTIQANYVDQTPITSEQMLETIAKLYKNEEDPSGNRTSTKASAEMIDINALIDKFGETDEDARKIILLAQDYFRLFASYCKNDAFSIENEYRIALLPMFTKGSAYAKINYHVMASGVIRPYIKVGFLRSDDGNDISSIPIKSITIGPAGNQQSVFDSVVHRIKYGKTMVWDYWKNRSDNMFWGNFKDYVCGSLVRYAEKNAQQISRNTISSVCEGLWKKWCEDTGVDEKNNLPDGLADQCIKCLESTQRRLVGGRKNISNTILVDIYRDNFFSKEGIWIKKSQIAYVF